MLCGINKHVGNQGKEKLGTNEHINYNNDKLTVIPTIDLHITQLLIVKERKKNISYSPAARLITITFY